MMHILFLSNYWIYFMSIRKVRFFFIHLLYSLVRSVLIYLFPPQHNSKKKKKKKRDERWKERNKGKKGRMAESKRRKINNQSWIFSPIHSKQKPKLRHSLQSQNLIRIKSKGIFSFQVADSSQSTVEVELDINKWIMTGSSVIRIIIKEICFQ